MLYKPELRKKMRVQRKALHRDAIESASDAIAAQVVLLNAFIDSQTIAIYWPHENEVDTQPIIHAAFQQQKTVLLPVVPSGESRELSFYPYRQGASLQRDRFGILMPELVPEAALAPASIDLVFSPLVAFDAQCHRIGRGAGYYDHTFSFVKTASVKRPLLIGLGYEFQKVADTEPSKWDVSMDHIMTEADHYHRHD